MKMIRLRENRKLHGKTTFQNIPISIENRKGSVRKGVDDDGEEWRTKMRLPYGYIPGTEGVDGDALDVFVGPNEDAAFAYVVHCNTPDGAEFDEDKVMLGFASSDAAKRCFKQHYDDDKFFGGIDAIPMWKFRERAFVKKHTTKKLVASRAGASLQLPEDVFEKPEYESYLATTGQMAGRGTDQDMTKSILGHHQDIMENPEVREHGVKGQKWGVRNPRDAGSAKTNQQKSMQQNLQNDPRTMNMMQVVSRTQPQLNMIAQAQKDRAAKQAAQQMQQNQPTTPRTPEQQKEELKGGHEEALEHLKELGWKVLEVGSRLTGTEGAVQAIHSIVQSPAGHRMAVSSNSNGSHKLSALKPKEMKTSRTFESRVGNFLREAKKTYFARPMSHYNTDAEEANIDRIQEAFPNEGVSVPTTKKHAELGMGYFHEKIDKSKRLVLKPAKGKRLTAGVFSETVHALKRKIPVYALSKGKLRRVKQVEALRHANKSGLFGRVIFKKKRSA